MATAENLCDLYELVKLKKCHTTITFGALHVQLNYTVNGQLVDLRVPYDALASAVANEKRIIAAAYICPMCNVDAYAFVTCPKCKAFKCVTCDLYLVYTNMYDKCRQCDRDGHLIIEPTKHETLVSYLKSTYNSDARVAHDLQQFKEKYPDMQL